MNKYENLGVIGEGSYGVVMKCVHKEAGQVVAIKKFLETDGDHHIRKIAIREINMLKKLCHENLVNLIEVFRRKRRLYLVLEYVDHTILDELERHPGGLGEDISRNYTWQILRGVDFCHSLNVVHRDIKPENLLVSVSGVVKLCDFGFARTVTTVEESCTDYVATRWYRSPELLVGDTHYGKEVDVWAIGCVFAELMTGDPLFPGESDIDQLFLIIQKMGKLVKKHHDMMVRNPVFQGVTSKIEQEPVSPRKWFTLWPKLAVDFLNECLLLDPDSRLTTDRLLTHAYFTLDRFPDKCMAELTRKIREEFSSYYNIKMSSVAKKRTTTTTMPQKERIGMALQQSPSNKSNLEILSSNSLSSKILQPMLRPPTKITPLNSPINPKQVVNSKHKMEESFREVSNVTTMMCIPQTGSTSIDAPLSPGCASKGSKLSFHPVKSQEHETNIFQRTPFWSRKPVHAKIKQAAVESMPVTCNSYNLVDDFGKVHGERTLLHARLDVNGSSSNEWSSTDRNCSESNRTLPNIMSPAPLSPLRLDVGHKARKSIFAGAAASTVTLEPIPRRSAECLSPPSTRPPSQFSSWKLWRM